MRAKRMLLVLARKYLPVLLGAPLMFFLTLGLTSSRYGWKAEIFIVFLCDVLFIRLADDLADYNKDVKKGSAVFPDYALVILACAVGICALFFSGLGGVMLQAFYLFCVLCFGYNFYLYKEESDFSAGKVILLPLALAVLVFNVGTVGHAWAAAVCAFALSLEFYLLQKGGRGIGKADLFVKG